MPWPFRKSAPPPEQKSLSFGGFYFGSPLLAPASASYARLAREGYGQNAVAFACANKIATAVASVELQLFRQKGDDVKVKYDGGAIVFEDSDLDDFGGRDFLFA